MPMAMKAHAEKSNAIVVWSKLVRIMVVMHISIIANTALTLPNFTALLYDSMFTKSIECL